MDSAHVARIIEQLTSRLQKVNKFDEFQKSFSKYHTNSERVACLFNLPEAEGLFHAEVKFKGKNKREADVLRAEGNNLFKSGKYSAAVSKYTQSIIMAPSDSESLPLAFNNRSTANFYMKNYILCLQDIELAFMHNYPPKTCYKLYQRIGRCMYYLHHKEEAVKAFMQTITAVERAELDEENKKVMIDDMKKAIGQCSAISSTPLQLSVRSFNCCHQGIPQLMSAPNKEVPSLANTVEIRLDSYGGRGLFAKQNINIGDVLVIETPYSSALLKDFNLTHCHYCCNRVLLPIPCKQCSGIIFCSVACRESAWVKFHWAECHILENIQDARGDLSLLATRMVLSAGLDYLRNFDESSEDGIVLREAGFDEEGVYSSEDYKSAYSLVSHADKRNFKDLLGRTVSALFFLKHLELVGFFSGGHSLQVEEKVIKQSSEQGLKDRYLVGSHILRNIMMLPCNAHEVSEFSLNLSSPAMSATTELAAAIYPVLSLINHSCDPSVVRHSFGNICVARAIRNIRCGEELKDNYGALYPTMERAQRQSNLSTQYFFSCSCEACVGDWPQYFEIPFEKPVLRCSNCDGQVPIPAGNFTEFAKCTACQQSQDITQTLLHMGEMEPAYKEALTAVIDGNTSADNITVLLTYLRLVERHVHRPWRDINDCQEAIKQCLNMQGNCYPCKS